MKLSYIKKLNIAFSLSLFLLLFSSAASYYTIREFKNSVERVNHSYTVIAKLELLLSKIKDAETGTRGFVLSNRSEFLEPFHNVREEAFELLDEIAVLRSRDSLDEGKVAVLRQEITQRLEVAQEMVALKKAGAIVPIGLLEMGRVIMDQLRATVSSMQAREQHLLTKRVERSNRLSSITHFLIIIVAALAIIITYEFCKRLKVGYFKKTLLQRDLQRISVLMNQRIGIIDRVAAKISQGEYHVRIENSERDALGSLAISLNRMAAALENSFNAVKELMQKKDDFIGIAAHELKTPLTTIKASLQFVSRVKLEGQARNITPFIVKASHQANRLTDIVKDLLDVNIINNGKLDLKLSTFSVRNAIPELVDDAGFNQKGHRLILKGDLDSRVTADKFRIEQAMVNLVSNAVKYSPENSEIIIEAVEDNGEIKVLVTDFGVGIPADKIPFIFDRYYRVHETSQYYSGLGLGLYITSEIIKRHGGRIGLISEEGKGTTVWFTLPLQPEAL